MPFGADPLGPGLDKGRNDPHNLPAIPGFPSSEARGRLKGSRLVFGESMASAAPVGDDGDDNWDTSLGDDATMGIAEAGGEAGGEAR